MVSETEIRVVTSPYRRNDGFCGITFCGPAESRSSRREFQLPPELPKVETEVEDHMVQLRAEVTEQRKRLKDMEEHLKMVTNYNFKRPSFQRPVDLSFSRSPNPATRRSPERDLEEGCFARSPNPAKRRSPERDVEEGFAEENSTEEFAGRVSKTGNVFRGSAKRDSQMSLSRPSGAVAAKAEDQPLTPKASCQSAPKPQQLDARSQRRIFDQDMLQAIYDRPYRKARQSGAMAGGGVMGLMSMPFGPIGMVAGGTLGALAGGVVGLWVDNREARKQVAESEAQKRKLKSLVRWALDHFHEEDEIVELIEHVVLEFKPTADIADGSKHGRKMLKLLDGWIAQKKVTRNLWVYMDMLLQRWRELNRVDFLKSMRVFQTLTVMYQHSSRVLDEQEEQFLARMQRLLEHDSVKLVMAHAQAHPTQNEAKLMECMVYADAIGVKKKRNTVMRPIGSPGDPSSPMLSEKGDSDSDDDDEVSIQSQGRPPSTSHRQSISGPLLTQMATPNRQTTPNSQTAGTLNLNLGVASHNRSRSSEVSKDLHPSRSRSPRNADGDFSNPAIQRQPSMLKPASKTEPRYIKQLKKPFFKGWDDFMDFDPHFKHKMPITYSEFELVREKSTQSLQGWDLCVDRKEIKVAKIQNDTGCITLRAWATVPGVDLMVAFFLFADHRERVKWDKVFAKMDVVEENCQGSDVLYSLMKVPAVTARDFLQYRRCRIKEDNSIEIVLRSAEHPDMPEQKGAIRAESYIAGYVLSQTFEPDGTPLLHIFLMTCLDIKGLIPKWIINAAAPRKPAEWVETLKKAATDYQKSHPNYKEKLEEVLRPYRETNECDYEDVLVEEEEETPQRKLSKERLPPPIESDASKREEPVDLS